MNVIHYKFRLYPNKEQEKYFAQCFGNSRFLWNKMLEDSEKHYKETGKHLKITSYLPYKRWFFEKTDSTLCSNVWKNLRQAYKNFFESGFGKPKFKSKKTHMGFYTSNNIDSGIRIQGNKIRLPKIGWIKAIIHIHPSGVIKNATIFKDTAGNYFAHVICDTSKNFILRKVNKSIGLDLGIKSLYTDDKGNKIVNPRFHKKSLKKIKKLQKNLSRKRKGSKNYEKARIKLAKTYKKVENQRKDYLHKESKKLINDNQVICLESLSVKEICNSRGNKNFRKATYDTGLGMFISFIVYKAKLYGRTIKTVPKYFPSSQICSSCNELHPEMKNLGNRTLVCKSCGTIIDRDTNAAINILNNAK